MLLEHNNITLNNFTKQDIIFTELGVKAVLKDFINDEIDGDYVIVDFYKKNQNGIFEEIQGEQDNEIYTNGTVDNLIRNLKGYIITII